MKYEPRVGDVRISKTPDSEGKYWVWRFQIDGVWEFIEAASDVMVVRDIDPVLDWVSQDDLYTYYEVS